MKLYLLLFFAVLFSGAATAQNLTIEGHLFNLADEPVAGAVVTLNTSDSVQTTTDTNGFFRFSGVGYPTAAELLQQNTALQPGPVNVEVFDLAGRSILQTRARLTSAGTLEGVEPFPALTPGKLYLQQLTDKTGRSVTGKFIATANAGLPGIRAANQNIRSLLKSATDAYNYNITVTSPDNTFRDTTMAVEGFNKEMNSHEAEYFVNEFVRISGNYSAGLDTIINKPVAVFDVRQLFSDDDYQRLGFQISEEYKDVVLVDKDSEKIVLDRTKAPKKGRFGIKAIDPDNNVTDELLVSYNENAVEVDLTVRNSVTNELLDNADIYVNSFDNHFNLADLTKSNDGSVKIFAEKGTETIVRVDGDKYGYVDMKNGSDTINAFVAPNDFPMVWYNQLNRGSGDREVVKWDKNQMTQKILTKNESLGTQLSDEEIQKLATFGDTLESMMEEKGIYDKPFSAMKKEYIDTIDYENLQSNCLYTLFTRDENGNGSIGLSFKKIDNIRTFDIGMIEIRYPSNEYSIFIGMLQEYMSAFYGRAPPHDEDVPTDGSLFKESGTADHITDSDAKIIKHHLNQENSSWFGTDSNKNKLIEISHRAGKKNNQNELVPYVQYYK